MPSTTFWPTVEFLSTLSLRRATAKARLPTGTAKISIHALLAESDLWPISCFKSPCDFYPRSPCGERRLCNSCLPCRCNFYPRSPCGERRRHFLKSTTASKFLSTLSLRRATVSSKFPRRPKADFYPRSPCGERHFAAGDLVANT